MPPTRPRGPELTKQRAGIRRGDVVEVDLRGAVGRESSAHGGDRHPCVVISNDELNTKLSTVIVVPITSHGGKGAAGIDVPLPAGAGGLDKDSGAEAHQVRTIDRHERVVGFYGKLPEELLERVVARVKLAFEGADLSEPGDDDESDEDLTI